MPDELPISDSDLELPADLRRAIGDLHSAPVEVPVHLDRMILSAARVCLDRRKRAIRVLRWGTAIAAAVVLLAIARFDIVHKPAASPIAMVGDANGDGHVDILDALIVARGMAQHEKLPAAWDVNGDGVVDQKDVDLIAQMAVNVSKAATR
jgi:Dockerin type I domain